LLMSYWERGPVATIRSGVTLLASDDVMQAETLLGVSLPALARD
jgi:hypothetical protein